MLQEVFTTDYWLDGPGLKQVAIIIGTIIVYLVYKIFVGRLVKAVLMIKKRTGVSNDDLEKRAATLSSVIVKTGLFIIVIIGLMMLLESFGISIGPILAGAGIVGIALGFGAQSVIRDILNGIFVLAEDQFVEGDWIKIKKDISGQVESFTLRRTVLRDLEGNTHVVPNGEMKIVTNYTYHWSRTLVTVSVAYKENLDNVLKVLEQIAHDLSKDEKFKELIIDEPKVLGVDKLDNYSVKIKLMLKTGAEGQWPVKRELLKRIKETFDREGIEIPYPTQKIEIENKN